VSVADAPASPKARQRLVLRLQELGVPEDERQRHVCAVWTRGRARSRRELTEAEAGSLYARLREMNREQLAAVLATPAPPVLEVDGCPVESGERSSCPYPPGRCCMTTPAPAPANLPGRLRLDGIDPGCPQPDYRWSLADEAAAPEPDLSVPAGTITCGGPLTAHDAAELRAFGAFLEQAGPPPTAATKPEPDPADPSTWTDEDWVADAEGTGPLADVPHEVEEPPAIEPPCRTPEEVEAAALAAVERFRARQAAGIVPEPPTLGSIPPRTPLHLPPAPDRYCLARCYCGGCPQYAEQRAAAERAYRQELTAARNRDPRR